MKVVFLNAWHAKMRDNLRAFILEQAPTTDVFCFQEAFEELQVLCSELLPDYQVFLAKRDAETYHPRQAMYLKPDIKVLDSGTLFADIPAAGLCLYALLQTGDRQVYICNAYGTPRPTDAFGDKPDDKKDAPARLAQSKTLIDFFAGKEKVIIGGDFNMLPDTTSIQMFSQNGYQDLIHDFGITNTRNRLVWERYPDTPQYYSDYVFITKDLHATSFVVPENEISDHLPLILEVAL